MKGIIHPNGLGKFFESRSGVEDGPVSLELALGRTNQDAAGGMVNHVAGMEQDVRPPINIGNDKGLAVLFGKIGLAYILAGGDGGNIRGVFPIRRLQGKAKNELADAEDPDGALDGCLQAD